jgi:hypothetical protein
MALQGSVELSGQILCIQCKGDRKVRFDCRQQSSHCSCVLSSANAACKCCRVCRFIVTVRTDSRQFASFDYKKFRRITDTGDNGCDTCGECKTLVYHEYLYTGSLGDSEESSDVPYISVFNTSIHILHYRAIKRYQQCMRRRVPEKISVIREKSALALGRQLTKFEVENIWKDYLMFHNAEVLSLLLLSSSSSSSHHHHHHHHHHSSSSGSSSTSSTSSTSSSRRVWIMQEG